MNVTIGTQEVKMKATAAGPLVYRRAFGRDLMLGISTMRRRLVQSLKVYTQLEEEAKAAGKKEFEFDPALLEYTQEDLELFEGMAWTFAKCADPDIPDLEEWLAQFGPQDIYGAIPQLLELWDEGEKTTVESKKKSKA